MRVSYPGSAERQPKSRYVMRSPDDYAQLGLYLLTLSWSAVRAQPIPENLWCLVFGSNPRSPSMLPCLTRLFRALIIALRRSTMGGRYRSGRRLSASDES